MLALDLLLLLITLTGHFAACVWLFNRMHAQHLSRMFVFFFDRILAGGTIAVLLLYVLRGLNHEAYIGTANRLLDASGCASVMQFSAVWFAC